MCKPEPPSDLRHLHAWIVEIPRGEITPQRLEDIPETMTFSCKSSGEAFSRSCSVFSQ